MTRDQTGDAENRLNVVTDTVTGQVTRFVYDGDGNRVLRIGPEGTTVYIGDYYEKQGSVVTKYYYAAGQRVAMRVGGVVYYLHGDHLGSASLAANASEAKVSEMRYLPYGETRSGSMPTDRQFTGQRNESGLGFYDYNARQYDATLGRFLQADSIVPDPANPQSLNRYAYTLNNPLRYIDPSGHRECIDDECNWGLSPNTDRVVPLKGIPQHYRFSEKQWSGITTWGQHFGLPIEFVTGVLAAEVLYDTDWYDSIIDPAIWLAGKWGSIPIIGIGAARALERSQDGIALLGGRSFGPGIGQIHAATAIQAEAYWGDDFPAIPRSASERHVMLVENDTNIMYASAILRMYADQRVGSLDVNGQMTEAEMGAVFTRYHEDPGSAFGGATRYANGGVPQHSVYVDQLSPLIWYYRYQLGQ